MKLSLNWIKEYIDLPEISNEQLAYDLTMSTVEVESMTKTSESFDKMVLGQVLQVSPHPDADKLRVATVDIGEREVQIVCGGVNLTAGQKVAVALPGSSVIWHGEGDPVTIKETTLRGVSSYGMIAASEEIGLSDLYPATKEGEILDLSQLEARAGTPLDVALQLDDVIIEIDNKSLTNRPDLWGHYGIAREFSAIYNVDLKPLCPGAVLPEEKGMEVHIEDESLCRRFNLLHMEGLYQKESPAWMKRRLMVCDMRPINAIVDITNYVLLATGQPSHAFDQSHVHDSVHVRRARAGEHLEILNDADLELNETNLVIADAKSALSLAGIMGGKRDSILEDTTGILLEVANFEPMNIRKTAKHYGLRTESSSRFEKGLDTQRVDEALELSVLLFQQLFPEVQMISMTENYPVKTRPAEVELDLETLEKKIGKAVEKDVIKDILDRLGFEASIRSNSLYAVAPSWRSTGDISMAEDIIEEIARIIGYEAFEAVTPKLDVSGAVRENQEHVDRRLREYFAQCGMQEIVSYPWISDHFLEASGEAGEHVVLDNPPAPDHSKLRKSMIPNLLEAIDINLPNFDQFSLFEVATVFEPVEASRLSEVERLPIQRKQLGFAKVGHKGEDLFFEMKGILESLGRSIMIEPLAFEQLEKPPHLDKYYWLNILSQGHNIGHLGLLGPAVKKEAGFKRGEVLIGQLDVEGLVALSSRDNRHEPISALPLIQYDLSILFDNGVKWKEIKELIEPEVKGIEFLDEYRGEQLGPDKKSLSFRVWFESVDKMMTSEDVEKRVDYLLKLLEQRFDITLRDH